MNSDETIALPISPERYLSTISPKDKCWDDKHIQTLEIADLYGQTELPKYGLRMKDCSRHLGFRRKLNEAGEEKFKLHAASFCRVRFCPTCQWRRSLKWVARFRGALPRILEDYPDHKFALLTLTVRNCPLAELRQTIKHMNESWMRLVKLKVWPALGFIKSIEVTRSAEGEAHPHIHVLLMLKRSYFSGKNYLSQAKFTELWQKCLRVDYTPIVNIKAVKPAKGIDTASYIQLIESSIVETIKYSVKPSDFQTTPPESQLTNSEWLEGITEQLLNTRAISLGGVIKDYLSEEEPDDLIHIEEEPEQEEDNELHQYLFTWNYRVARYVLYGNTLTYITIEPSEPSEPHTE